MDPNDAFLSPPQFAAGRRGSDPGPSGHNSYGAGTGANTVMNMGLASSTGGSSGFPNTPFNFPQPDPLRDVSSSPYIAPQISLQNYYSSSVLDSVSHDLKLFEAQLQECPGKYESRDLLQLQTSLLHISSKISSAINLRSTYPIPETPVPVQQPPERPQQQLPSTTTKSSLSERFACRLCERKNKRRVLGSRSTFSRHIADAHGGKTKHLCHIPGCTFVRFRSDKIKKHRELHGKRMPEFDALKTSGGLEVQMPPPRKCAICNRIVGSWDEWMTCIAAHCRCLDSTPSDETGGYDDDDNDDNSGGGNGNGGGGGNAGSGYDGQGVAYQNDLTAGMGSIFDVDGTYSFTAGGYGYAKGCNQAAPCSPKTAPSDKKSHSVASSECDTLAVSNEDPETVMQKGNDLNQDESSSVSPSGNEDKPKAQHITFAFPFPTKGNAKEGYLRSEPLRQPPIPRKRLARTVLNCCLPPSNDNTTAYKRQGKKILSSKPNTLVRKNSFSWKSLVPTGDTRSPRLISSGRAASSAEDKQRPVTLQPNTESLKCQASRGFWVF